MSLLAKFQATHGVINNAPKIISVMATVPVLTQRLFMGNGAPSATTLNAGNGKFCGGGNGYVVAASLGAGGTGYILGDVLTVSGGGITTACQITVDAVTSSGVITDFHVSTTGNYTSYPANAVSVTGGTGSGATFNLALQPPDFYLNTTAGALYVCTEAGSNNVGGTGGSIWATVAGALEVEELDGSPDVPGCSKLIFPNASLTNASGVVTFAFTTTAVGSDGNTYTLTTREVKVADFSTGVCKQRTRIVGLISPVFQAPDDPA